jgi:hypothetical protein
MTSHQLGVLVLDAVGGQAVEDAELFFAQALVGLHRHEAVLVEVFHQQVRGLARAQVRRVQHDVGLRVRGQAGEPGAQRRRLALAQDGQRHVDVALGNLDVQPGRSLGLVACDVACALPVPDQPNFLRPLLFHTYPLSILTRRQS